MDRIPSNPNLPQIYPAIVESYAGNPRVLIPLWTGAPVMSLSFVKSVSTKILMSESNYGAYGNWETMYDDWNANTLRDNGFANHLGTMNCLFIDGHVKAMKPLSTATPVNMWGTMADSSGTGDCPTSPRSRIYGEGINCDEVSSVMANGMAGLQAKS